MALLTMTVFEITDSVPLKATSFISGYRDFHIVSLAFEMKLIYCLL